MKKKTFEAEDTGALDRADNANDRNNEHTSKPDAGFHGVSKRKKGASQISAVGESEQKRDEV